MFLQDSPSRIWLLESSLQHLDGQLDRQALRKLQTVYGRFVYGGTHIGNVVLANRLDRSLDILKLHRGLEC